jgi:hypothetical protein
MTATLGPDEIKEFDKLQFGRLPWLQRVLESKILAAAQVIIIGREVWSRVT